MEGKEAVPLTLQANEKGGWFLDTPGFADYALVELSLSRQ